MEESELKDILLALLEPSDRNRPSEYIIPTHVKGWRFPSANPDAAAGVDNVGDQYQQPVCFWTGVTCDPIDGSITGLNLGNGFYVQTLLGLATPTFKDEDDEEEGHRHDRMITQQRDGSEINLHKERYSKSHYTSSGFHRFTKKTSLTPTNPTFPTSLGKLRSLRFINLSSNQLQGSIPKSVLSLPNLEIFDVTSNDLEGVFPHFESDALRVLDASKNRFHGALDDDLFGHPDIGPHTAPYLFSLVKFDISHNGFNGTIPLNGRSGFYDIGKHHEESMQNLQYFDIGYNLFSGTICNNFGTFENLQGLFLEHNRLVGTIPRSIFRGAGTGAHPMALVQLFLQHNSLSGTLNEGLGNLPNLREIYVDGNKLTGGVPKSLCNFELNDMFLNNTQAARGCDGISCPANSISLEGVAPCTACPRGQGAFHRYMGQHDTICRGVTSEVEVLDLFFEETHGDEWLESFYLWERGSPACERLGVECNDRGQVTKIILPSLGLRGPLIPELGFLSNLRVLDVSNNQLTGFLPSDLRFLPLKRLDLRGSQMQGVVPPLLCIKEGVNGNGIGPAGTDFNLLWACENIVCPRGTYSRIGRASLAENEGDEGIQCKPCYDDEAALYLGRDHCTDISIAGLQIRRGDINRGLVTSIPVIFALAFLSTLLCCIKRRRQKISVSADSGGDNDSARRPTPQRQSSLMQRWTSTPQIESDSDEDDWTAADSEVEDVLPAKSSIELPRSKSRLPDVI